MQRPLVQALHVDNPFYFLGALGMLAGAFSLNDSLDWSPLPDRNPLMILGLLNRYEILLLCTGVYMTRRDLCRDARTLFVPEAFFLFDARFLNSELFNTDLVIGGLANAGILLLGVGKLAVVFKGLKVPLTDARFALILDQFFVLVGLPGLFKQVSLADAMLPPMTLYAVW